jgi:hypothetical protein
MSTVLEEFQGHSTHSTHIRSASARSSCVLNSHQSCIGASCPGPAGPCAGPKDRIGSIMLGYLKSVEM